MTVEDALIELQVVACGSDNDTNKDDGMIFNYYIDSQPRRAFTLTIPQPELVLVSLF